MTDRILYVDDEDDIREVAVMSLELDPAFEVKACSSGAEALEIIRDWKPDLILLDVMMPGMDGPTTFRHLIAEHGASAPPVLFCTARLQASDIQSYLALGAKGVVSKPFDPMTLSQQVRSHLE
ncbi:MAG TPA: response regulator [Sphingomicrobium sp.]